MIMFIRLTDICSLSFCSPTFEMQTFGFHPVFSFPFCYPEQKLLRFCSWDICSPGHCLSKTLAIWDKSYLGHWLLSETADFFFNFWHFRLVFSTFFKQILYEVTCFPDIWCLFFPFFQNKYKKGSFRNYFYLGLTHLHLEISNFQM